MNKNANKNTNLITPLEIADMLNCSSVTAYSICHKYLDNIRVQTVGTGKYLYYDKEKFFAFCKDRGYVLNND